MRKLLFILMMACGMANAQTVDQEAPNKSTDNAVGTAIGGALGAIAGATIQGGGNTVIYQPAPTMYNQPTVQQNTFGAFPDIYVPPRVPYMLNMNVIRPIPTQVYAPWVPAETWPLPIQPIQPVPIQHSYPSYP